jgi:hypothetical protein
MNHGLLLSKCCYSCCKNLNCMLRCFVCFSGRFSIGWTSGTVWPWRISELLRIKQKKSLIRWADLLVGYLVGQDYYAVALWQYFVSHMGKNKRIAFVLVGTCSWERCARLKMATHKFIVYIWHGLIKNIFIFVNEWWIGGWGAYRTFPP